MSIIYASASVRSSALPALLTRAVCRIPSHTGTEKHLDYQTIKNEYCTPGQEWESEISASRTDHGNHQDRQISANSTLVENHLQGIAPSEGSELALCATEMVIGGGNGKDAVSSEYLIRLFLAKMMPFASAASEEAIRAQKGLNEFLNEEGTSLARARRISFANDDDGGLRVFANLSWKRASSVEPASSVGDGNCISVRYELKIKLDSGWDENGGNMAVTIGPIDISVPDSLQSSLGKPVEGLRSRMYEWLLNFFSEFPGIGSQRVAIAIQCSNDGTSVPGTYYSVVNTAGLPSIQTAKLPRRQIVENDFIDTSNQRALAKQIAALRTAESTPQVTERAADAEIDTRLNALSNKVDRSASRIRVLESKQAETDKRVDEVQTAVDGHTFDIGEFDKVTSDLSSRMRLNEEVYATQIGDAPSLRVRSIRTPAEHPPKRNFAARFLRIYPKGDPRHS